MTRILVVDDEPQILRALRINLAARHYEVAVAADGGAALREAARLASRPGHTRPRPARHRRDRRHPRTAWLDLDPHRGALRPGRRRGQGGRARRGRRRLRHQAVQHRRAARPRPRGDPAGRFHESELAQIHIGDRVVDLVSKTVSDGVRLTPTEWHLLEILLRNPGKLVSQRQLLTEVWGREIPQGDPLPAPVHDPDAQETGAGPGPPGSPADRAGHGIPLQPLTAMSVRRGTEARLLIVHALTRGERSGHRTVRPSDAGRSVLTGAGRRPGRG